MKKFDYFCIVYSIALLVFGFNDDVPKKNLAKVTIGARTASHQSTIEAKVVHAQRYGQSAILLTNAPKQGMTMRNVVNSK